MSVAPPVTFSSVPEAQRTICIESGRHFKLQCEVSDPDAQVWWHKDGNEVLPQDARATVAYEEAIRTLSVQSAELCHSGTYSCQTNNDAISFHVEIKGDLMISFMKTPHEMCKLSKSSNLLYSYVLWLLRNRRQIFWPLSLKSSVYWLSLKLMH